MARPFIASRNNNRTIMAAEVFSTKPRLTSSDQRKIWTGTIIGMARALGETAPLLMIGMRAFVATPPGGFSDPASVLPVQIFLWSDEVSRGFVEKTSAAIIVLLLFLLAMNGLAIYLRNRFERRW